MVTIFEKCMYHKRKQLLNNAELLINNNLFVV